MSRGKCRARGYRATPHRSTSTSRADILAGVRTLSSYAVFTRCRRSLQAQQQCVSCSHSKPVANLMGICFCTCRDQLASAYSASIATKRDLAIQAERLDTLIYEIRGQKVMLDT